MISANNIAREVREPGSVPAGGALGAPPAFLTVPTTVARKAVKTYHLEGVEAARAYVQESKLQAWSAHRNPSMKSNALNTLAGIEAYFAADRAVGRNVLDIGRTTVIELPAGPIKVFLDVVLEDGNDLASRSVFWDGLEFLADHASTAAAVYALAMRQIYPGQTITTIGVWQGRHQSQIEVPFGTAIRQRGRANQVREKL